MAKKDLGKTAAKWLHAKAKEVSTANRQQRDAAEYEADESARKLKNDSIGEAVMTAIPGLRKLRDRQEEQQRAADVAQERAEREELAGRPVGRLELRVSGAMEGTWRGTAPTLVEVRDPDGGTGEHDPFAQQATLVVDLGPLHNPSAVPGSATLGGWRFEVPGYTGAGTYDLAAAGMQRRAADAEPEYIEWELHFGDDEGFYFQPDIGPSAVTVDDAVSRLAVTMTLTGALGQVNAEATLELDT